MSNLPPLPLHFTQLIDGSLVYIADQMHAYALQYAAQVEAEREEDAERYRWLRDEIGALAIFSAAYHNAKNTEELNAVIDAARKAEA